MKKKFLTLLAMSYGLSDIEISTYRTLSCGGQYAVAVGWKMKCKDGDGATIVDIATPEGYNDLLYEFLKLMSELGMEVCWVGDNYKI